jgi:hypothetical protein
MQNYFSQGHEKIAFFLASQKTENEFAGPVDPLKHRFLALTQVAFWVGQKAEMRSQDQSYP